MTDEKCHFCGATIEHAPTGDWRHKQSIAKACDLDDPTSTTAEPKR
jgi:hypothetical protein